MFHFKIVCIVFCLTVLVAVLCSPNRISLKNRAKRAASEDLYDVEGLLNSYGYPFENHEVETEDGYILTLHRVPYGRNDSGSSTNITRPPVLVIHGILCSSINFMFMGPENSIIPMLADAGYDVWAGNNRGNTWSRKHVSLDPDTDDAFWNYSIHEMGYYDDTAMIDYILNNTGSEKLFYVGHSQGTSQFFIMASTRPEYNEKILLMSALAPVVYGTHIAHPVLRILTSNYAILDIATRLLNLQELLPHSEALSEFCQLSIISSELCIILAFVLMGFDSEGVNRDEISNFYQNFPQGTSTKNFKHLLQETTYGKFAEYDYGNWIENFAAYGQLSPPVYNLSLAAVPVALYYSQNDWFAATVDVDKLADELPNLQRKYLIADEVFTHGDFMYGKDLDTRLHDDVISYMNEFVNN